VGAISECSGSKSPRLDGYNFSFIKSNWGILVDDIVKALNWFQEIGFIPTGRNTIHHTHSQVQKSFEARGL